MVQIWNIIILTCLVLAILNVSMLIYLIYGFMEIESILPAILKLEENLSDIREQLDELKRAHQWTMPNCTTFNVNYSMPPKDCEKFEEALVQISKRVFMAPKDFPSILEDATRKTSILELLLHQIKITKFDQPRIKAEKVLEWVLINLEYIPDDFHEVITRDRVVQVQNRVAYPDEVIDRGGGDCEDLAILVYAILYRSLNEHEKVYLIALEGIAPYSYRYRLGWAHIAVLYDTGKEFIVIDPAGAYMTGRKYSLNIVFGEDSGDERSMISQNPLTLPPQIKSKLIKKGVAKLTFIQITHTKSTTMVDTMISSDAIHEWIKYWEASIPQVHVSFLANSTFYVEFNSTQDFLKFIQYG